MTSLWPQITQEPIFVAIIIKTSFHALWHETKVIPVDDFGRLLTAISGNDVGVYLLGRKLTLRTFVYRTLGNVQ